MENKKCCVNCQHCIKKNGNYYCGAMVIEVNGVCGFGKVGEDELCEYWRAETE